MVSRIVYSIKSGLGFQIRIMFSNEGFYTGLGIQPGLKFQNRVRYLFKVSRQV